MNKLTVEVMRVVAPLLVLAGGYAGYRAIGQPPEAQKVEPDELRGELVEAVEVQPARNGLVIDLDGVVVPYRELVLGADVAGRVTRKSLQCRTGTFVDAQTELLRIDRQVYEIAELRSRSEWERAKLEYEEVKDVELANLEALEIDAQRKLRISEAELERVQSLYEDGIATRSTLDAAEQSMLQSRSELTNIDNQRRLREKKVQRLALAEKIAKANWTNAARDLVRSVVKAPCCGVIIEEHVEQDGFVQRGEPLLVIEDTSRVEVRCNLTLDEIAWLWRDRHASAPRTPTTPFEEVEPITDSSAPFAPFEPNVESSNAEVTGETESTRDLAEADPPTEDDPLAEYFPEDQPFVDTDPSDNAAYLLPAVPVVISFEVAGRLYEWDGVFKRYDGSGLDERTRTVPCRIEVPNPRAYRVDGATADLGQGPRALLRGMYVSVRATVTPRMALLTIPEGAVRPGNEVWRVVQRKDEKTGEPEVDENGASVQRLDIVPVNIAWRKAGEVFLDAETSPIRSGDQLVVSPLPTPVHDMLLTVQGRRENETDRTASRDDVRGAGQRTARVATQSDPTETARP